jgi:hypothetical protein
VKGKGAVMRTPDKNNAATPHLATVSAPVSSAMDDAVELLFTDDRVFASLAAWLEEDLIRLEERFADFRTRESLYQGDR